MRAPVRGEGVLLATIKRWTAAAGLVFSIFAILGSAQSPPDLVLTGDVTGAQNKTYFEIPFIVPAGTHRISVDFQYTGSRAARDTRPGYCRSGAFSRRKRRQQEPLHHQRDRRHPFLSARRHPAWPVAPAHLRAEYAPANRLPLPGRDPLQCARRGFQLRGAAAGHRHALVSRRPAHAHSPQRRQLREPERQDGSLPGFRRPRRRRRRAGWTSSPSPTITPTRNMMRMRELQPYFDRVLLIPGREMTTFHGHFNIFGVTQFIDYRVAAGGLDLNSVLRDVESKGGIASVSHAHGARRRVLHGLPVGAASGRRHESVYRGRGHQRRPDHVLQRKVLGCATARGPSPGRYRRQRQPQRDQPAGAAGVDWLAHDGCGGG